MDPLSARKTLPSSYTRDPTICNASSYIRLLTSISAYLGPAAGRSDTESLATSPTILCCLSQSPKLPVIYRDQSSFSKAQASVDTARTDATAEPTGTHSPSSAECRSRYNNPPTQVLGCHKHGQYRNIQASPMWITQLGNTEHGMQDDDWRNLRRMSVKHWYYSTQCTKRCIKNPSRALCGLIWQVAQRVPCNATYIVSPTAIWPQGRLPGHAEQPRLINVSPLAAYDCEPNPSSQGYISVDQVEIEIKNPQMAEPGLARVGLGLRRLVVYCGCR
ncbi:unnamed protein product [Fusarium graminearum]|uniref:Chromosome 1, complete genome n=1 Tax=Gibberella zeae (strain ATCC MYA-4620 / CBS 123657 / FGSC 9075 / NRRL 31084 / PH-1) TaxID=229533 RepID=I1RAZ5_GIBZE|nr:hypothetical protein FGSG_00692 [Fusarium graminearum PH-1]ESU05907.1 hypothetical protein FGSG_00692 [Fusarium graminearum PH-1]EYB33520.1 hypothetical protein FG05_00692 [Fusarium graminearum]CEF72671.1 unnamed protein product [Fusarium graminearum]CZS75936.1 unnamed protein product [Fusarium graminearum]|eukprot:XP_011316392.1 hypothetical protein FGSG_00692 [Fusarium graminearum PH-1]